MGFNPEGVRCRVAEGWNCSVEPHQQFRIPDAVEEWRTYGQAIDPLLVRGE